MIRLRFPTTLLLLAFATLGGCSFVDDFGRFEVGDAAADTGGPDTMVPDTGTGDSGDSAMDGGADAADSAIDTAPPDTLPPLPSCATAWLEPGVPVTESTAGGSDDHEGSCGGAGSNDVVNAFVAPADDYYIFETNGSDFDTVLYTSSSCDVADETACNVDGTTPPQSEFVRFMSAGELAVVFTDGNAAAVGSAQTTVSAATCPDANLDALPLPVRTTTVGRPDDHSSPCGGAGAGDRAFRYTAPSDGMYRFAVVSGTAGYAPLLSVERGPVCGGEIIQCHPSPTGEAQVTRYLSAGEVLTLRVDGEGADDVGDYELDVEALSTTCETVELSDSVSGNLRLDDPHTHSGSCGEARLRYGTTDYPNPDVALLVRNVMLPPEPPCSFACVAEVTAEFPFILSVQETDTCNGNELACVTSTERAFDEHVGSVELIALEPENQDAIIILERVVRETDVSGISVPFGGGYRVEYFCVGIC